MSEQPRVGLNNRNSFTNTSTADLKRRVSHTTHAFRRCCAVLQADSRRSLLLMDAFKRAVITHSVVFLLCHRDLIIPVCDFKHAINAIAAQRGPFHLGGVVLNRRFSLFWFVFLSFHFLPSLTHLFDVCLFCCFFFVVFFVFPCLSTGSPCLIRYVVQSATASSACFNPFFHLKTISNKSSNLTQA